MGTAFLEGSSSSGQFLTFGIAGFEDRNKTRYVR